MKKTINEFPTTLAEYLKCVARETAKMSYPGRMSNLVEKGTKKVIECYFINDFPIQEVWNNAEAIEANFAHWHRKWVIDLSRVLMAYDCVKGDYNSEALAAKFLDTFMFQLMKYEKCRPLWKKIHLPIDSKVLKRLRLLSDYTPFKKLEGILDKKTAYSLSYEDYNEIQRALWEFACEFNRSQEVQFISRNELNSILWQ